MNSPSSSFMDVRDTKSSKTLRVTLRPLSIPPVLPKASPFSGGFFDSSADAVKARAIYFKVIISGIVLVSVLIFAAFPIFWGSLWKSPEHVHNLKGWVVDFDGGSMGQTVTQAFGSISGNTMISWSVRSASDFPGGPSDLAAAVLDEQCWVAISVNPGSSIALENAIASGDSSYDGAKAVTAFATEARNENAFRNIIRPQVQGAVQDVAAQFASENAKSLAAKPNIVSVLAKAPQTITLPLFYTLENIRPFDVPVAATVTFIGLIYLVILSFMVTMIHMGARAASGLERRLTLGSLIGIRLVTPLILYLYLSLLYSLLQVAFQLPFNRFFKGYGFILFWALTWASMMALGLALEAMVTLLTPKFIPFFLILLVITNVSVCALPLELLPKLFQYGHVFPAVQVSVAVRSIVFGTKSHLGRNFGILVVWALISCITLPIFTWMARKELVKEHEMQNQEKSGL